VGRDDHLTLVGAVMRGGGEGIMARGYCQRGKE